MSKIEGESSVVSVRQTWEMCDENVARDLEVLTSLSPIARPQEHAAALTGLMTALAASPPAIYGKVLEVFPRIRRVFKGRRGLQLERARLSWAQGLLAAHVIPPSHARRHFVVARRKYVDLGRARESVAVTVDLAALAFPDRESITAWLDEIAGQDLFDDSLRRAVARAHAEASAPGGTTSRLQDALIELRELATSGEAEILPQLDLWNYKKSDDEILADLAKHPCTILRIHAARHEHLLRKFLALCEEEITSNPRRGKRLATQAVRMTALAGNTCLQAYALGAIANAHRALGRFHKAGRACDLAFRLAMNDPACLADLYRRRAHLLMAEGQYKHAVFSVNRSIQLYRGVDDNDGVGRGLLFRGVIHDRIGDQGRAKDDLSEALTLISPETSPQFHAAALNSFTIVLAKGSLRDFARAMALFPRVLKLYKGKRGLSAERAKLMWVQGLISARAHLVKPAIRLLTRSWKIFLKLELAEEIAAVTADLATLLYPDRGAMREIVARTARLNCFDHGIRMALTELERAARAEGTAKKDDADGALRAAILRLREVASGSSMPESLIEIGDMGAAPNPEPIGF